MPTYAPVDSTPGTDGLQYANQVIMPAAEADLFNMPKGYGFDPVPVLYGEAVIAVITLTAQGSPQTNSTYVVLQTSIDNGTTWVDVAGCVWTGIAGSATFFGSSGVAGNLMTQQTRQPGTAPQTTGANAMCLGGKIRFVGKSSLTAQSSSSASPGTPMQVLCSISYKLLALR